MEFEEAKEKAVKYLVLALRTEDEVKNKLRKIGADENVIDEVTNYLKDIGYIDDNKYVEAYLRQCVNMPKYSVYEIKMKLLQKGIDKDLISQKLSKFDTYNYEKSLIDKLINGKLKNTEELKRKAYLYRRGFKVSNMYEE